MKKALIITSHEREQTLRHTFIQGGIPAENLAVFTFNKEVDILAHIEKENPAAVILDGGINPNWLIDAHYSILRKFKRTPIIEHIYVIEREIGLCGVQNILTEKAIVLLKN